MVKGESKPSYTDGKGYWRNAAKITCGKKKITCGNLRMKDFREELGFIEVYSIKKLPIEKFNQ